MKTGLGDRKRKAEVVDGNNQTPQVSDEPGPKRLRADSNTRPASATSDRVHHWVRESRWPEKDFEPDPSMDGPPPKRTRSSSSSNPQSDSQLLVPDGSDQRSRASKSSPYQRPGYETLLAIKGGYMKNSQAGISASEKNTCQSLLTTPQEPPADTLFDDKCFLETIENLRKENEMRVVIDILRLIAPSAENLAARDMPNLKDLKETTNAGWNESIPVEGPRPQPDFSVGFRFTAFSEDQIHKLHYNLKLGTKTYFSATLEMYFPFLTSEVKCGEQALNIADRQNAHSMAVAIKGIAELYRRVGRAKELHGKVLGFSISHDHSHVRIFAHYPEIDTKGSNTECYRHPLREFIITDDGGKERWRAYQFVRNIYDSFAPKHLERVKSAIDQLPNQILQSSQSMQNTEGTENSQERMVSTAPSSQEVIFKKPALPRRGSVADLGAQLERQNQAAERQRQQSEEQLERQRQQSEQLVSLLSDEIAGLRAQLERQNQEAERQRQDAKQERDQLQAQLARLVELLAQGRERASSDTASSRN